MKNPLYRAKSYFSGWNYAKVKSYFSGWNLAKVCQLNKHRATTSLLSSPYSNITYLCCVIPPIQVFFIYAHNSHSPKPLAKILKENIGHACLSNSLCCLEMRLITEWAKESNCTSFNFHLPSPHSSHAFKVVTCDFLTFYDNIVMCILLTLFDLKYYTRHHFKYLMSYWYFVQMTRFNV
jgi:hypothetical protein